MTEAVTAAPSTRFVMPPAARAGSISFVTGVDHRMFDQLFPLMGSMRRYCAGTRLWVCDFGLTDPQKNLLRRMDVLLEIPPGVGPYNHAWYYKAALGRYVADLNTEAMVWIDVDMMVLCDIMPLIGQLNASMALGGDILAAPGNETVGDQIAVDPAPRYASLVAGLHPNTRYLNSGFFLCRSPAFLERWYQLCLTMPVEKLFEQNAFNVTALAAADNVRVLDMLTWNMCGQHIRDAVIEASGMHIVITGPQGRTLVLHATSSTRGDVVVQRLRLRINTTVFQVTIKVFAGPDILRIFQRELSMDSLAENFLSLTECGFGTPG
jgi:hypothetical protein